MDELRLTAAKLVVGEQPTEDLPALATEALCRGLDSPSLRLAAGISEREVRDARDYFVRALSELGIAMPEEQDAWWLLVHEKLTEIVNGTIDPIDGARWIWGRAFWRVALESDLRVFVGLASEAEDHPAAAGDIGRQVRSEAAEILCRGRLRPWLKLQARWRESPVREHGTKQALDLDQLSISEPLRSSLRRWADDFDAVSESPGPGPSGFVSVEEAEAFVTRGEQLRSAIQREYGASWHVEYMPSARAFPPQQR